MPSNPDDPAVVHVTLEFDATMSEEDVRTNMDRLLALNGCFNKMIEELKEIEAAELPISAKRAALMLSIVEFLESDPAVLQAGFVTKLVRPFLNILVGDMVREHSVRDDGARSRPADFTLPISGGRGHLIAAAHVLLRCKMRESDVKAWLKKHGVTHPARVIEWRHEMVNRKARPAEDTLLDVVAATFNRLLPAPNVEITRAEAEQLASEWVANAKALTVLYG